MNLTRLQDVLADEPKYRQKQVYQAIFSQLISDWSEAKNLPQQLREKLAENCPIFIDAEIQEERNSAKALIKYHDGVQVETVLIGKSSDRKTICISSQAGCPLNCSFCATGQNGWQRNLREAEIVEQVLFWARRLRQDGGRINNVVFMGMGEPLLNWIEVEKAIKTINDSEGLAIGARSISVSTSGIVPEIEKISKFPLQINLALSLHAANNDLRSRLMPINKKYPLEKLLPAIEKYLIKTNRVVMLEYMLLDGINDSLSEANKLVEIVNQLNGNLIIVNLLSYNNTGRFKASSNENVEKFKHILQRNRVKVTVRKSFGQEIDGACGQLAGKRRQ